MRKPLKELAEFCLTFGDEPFPFKEFFDKALAQGLSERDMQQIGNAGWRKHISANNNLIVIKKDEVKAFLDKLI